MRQLLFVLSVICLFISCSTQNRTSLLDKSWDEIDIINGFNFTGTPYRIKDYSSLEDLKAIHCNWVSFSPFRYMPSATKSIIKKSFPGQWFGESLQGTKEYIDSAHAHGLKVMIKPHIWVMNGGFTGDISLSKKERELWQEQYKEYVLTFAKICEEHNAEALSIGNELKTPILQDHEFWFRLIREVRTVYSGQVTYSANWDFFDKVPFWSELDAIGVNAYFPLTDKENPTKKDVKKGWAPWAEKIKKLKATHQKPVVFTELGYRATDHCCQSPWEYNTGNKPNEGCQALAFEIFFEEYYGSLVKGAFIWKWFDKNDNPRNDKYSPQGRKSLEVIKKEFKKAL